MFPLEEKFMSHDQAPRAASPSTAGPYVGGRAIALLIFLLLLNVFNILDRTLPQAFIVQIMGETGLTYTQFTLINGPLFGLVYAIAGIGMGALADRWARPKLIAAGLLIWSAMTAATGLATTAWQLTATRAAVAVGEASLSPSALSMLAEVFSPRWRGLVSSLYFIGVSVGAGAAFIIAGTLGASLGWRACFIILGLVGVFLAAIVVFLPDPRGRSTPATKVARPRLSDIVTDTSGALRGSVALPMLLLAALLYAFGLGGSVLDQAWLVNERGFEVARAQTQFGGLFLLGSTIGAVVGGPLADLLARWHASGRLIYLAIVFIVVGCAAVALRFLDPASPLFVPAYLITSAGFTLHFAAVIPSVQALAPGRVRATIIAVTLLAMALLGTSMGNAFVGFMADHLATLTVANPVALSIAGTNAAMLLALLPLIWAIARYRADASKFEEVG
jgi:MFS family permease